MQLAIDSYCYHRYFGEHYPGLETEASSRMTMLEFVERAHAFGVQGVSLESCYFTDASDEAIATLRHALDQHGLERVWAWGHPGGLQSGAAPQELEDLNRHTRIAHQLGAKVMRICCGGRRTRPAVWQQHRDALVPLLRKAAVVAEQYQVVLAIENHIDFYADELVELLQVVDSPWVGVCLDTANNLRMFEDPVEVARKLVPYTHATHIKDVMAQRGRNPHEFAFWPSVPTGTGLVDMEKVFGILKGAGYKGLLALEIDYLHPAYPSLDTAISDSIAAMRDLLAKT